MRVAKVFFESDVPGPVPCDGLFVWKNLDLDPKLAGPLTPYFWVEIPLQRRVTAIVVVVPQSEDKTYYSMQFLDFAAARETEPKLSEEWLPEHRQELVRPPEWIQQMVKQSKELWKPLTQKPYASKIAKFMHTLTPEEQKDLLGDLRKKEWPKRRLNLFICQRWPEWTKHVDQCTYKDFVEDCREHGLDITVENLKRITRDLGFPPFRPGPRAKIDTI
jgi:hypothetical protein